MEHYLDNSSTTKPSECAMRAMTEAAAVWGNPSSVHSLGTQAANLLRESRTMLAKSLGMARFSQDKLLFTSCGTESNNIAILGCAHSKNRSRTDCPGTVVISAGEHPSVDAPASQLEREGYHLIRVPTRGGVLDLDFLKESLDDLPAPVVLAAFMLVNNETGAVYDVKGASSLIKSKFPDALVHCDAVQGFTKLKFTPSSLGADTLTVSAHKIHSIRGAAALYISAETIKRKNITPVMPGGGQEGGFRSGTENLCSIAAFSAAAEDARVNYIKNREKIAALRLYLDEKLDNPALGIRVNKPVGEFLPDICNIILPSIRSETMLNFLSSRGVYVSAGSACSARSNKKSAALSAFGVNDGDIDSAIRISISHTNTNDDIDALIDGLTVGTATLQRKR